MIGIPDLAAVEKPDWNSIKAKVTLNIGIVHPATWSGKAQSFRSPPPELRDLDKNIIYRIEGLTFDTISNLDRISHVCAEHRAKFESQLQTTWAFSPKVSIEHEFLSGVLTTPSSTGAIGPFAPEQLDELPHLIAFLAEPLWCGLQTDYLIQREVYVSTGKFIRDLARSYHLRWAEKDQLYGDMPGLADLKIIQEYIPLSRKAAEANKIDLAAEYSRIGVSLLSENEHAPRWMAARVMSEFQHHRPNWEQIKLGVENKVNSRSMAMSEGRAEWRTLLPFRFHQAGLISPLTEAGREALSEREMRFYRDRFEKMSPSNPYRRGLELMETVERLFGFWCPFLVETVTSWPIHVLSKYVPSHTVENFSPDSTWWPDVRLEAMANLDHKKEIPFWAEIVLEEEIHPALDQGLPGIRELALSQLEFEKNRFAGGER